MPAAAVIPAPIAYVKVVAVKKLVVEPRAAGGSTDRWHSAAALARTPSGGGAFTVRKLECSKQACAGIR